MRPNEIGSSGSAARDGCGMDATTTEPERVRRGLGGLEKPGIVSGDVVRSVYRQRLEQFMKTFSFEALGTQFCRSVMAKFPDTFIHVEFLQMGASHS